MVLVETLILLTIIGYLLFKLGTKNHDYFKKRNIPHDKPKPFFGNIEFSFRPKRSFFYVLIDYHNKFKTKFYGIFNMTNAQITIKDPELIKQIFIKDFDHFTNHYTLLTPEDDALSGNVLISLKDQKWRDMRITLSPGFTGNKLRFMFELIRECSQSAIQYVKDEINSKGNDNNSIQIEGKDFFSRYTHNVIASVAFGLKINSYRDANNEFFKKSQKAINFSYWMLVKFFIFTYTKKIFKFFKLQLFDAEFNRYFVRLVTDTMTFRVKNNIVRPDMINLLLEARRIAKEYKQKTHIAESVNSNHNNIITNEMADASSSSSDLQPRDWTDEELVAQCFLFFFAGFETSSNLICFAVMELLANPEIQNTLYDEIHDLLERKDNNIQSITFEDIQGMKYLDMVVSEALRKWPPAIVTDRVCNKEYVIKDENVEVKLEPGDLIWINIVGMHHDPENFEQPEIFNPERFNDENRSNIKPMTYAPFGIGPRICIASRLALIQVKIILFNILNNFKIEATEKTILPIVIDPKSVLLKPKGGFSIKLTSRT